MEGAGTRAAGGRRRLAFSWLIPDQRRRPGRGA